MVEIVNARISTNAAAVDVFDALAGHFNRLHAITERDQSSIRALNLRKNETNTVNAVTTVKVTLTKMEDGWLLNGEIDNKYKPSWILFLYLASILLGLISGQWLLMLVGIGAMAMSGLLVSNRGKSTKQMVNECFELVKNQLNESIAVPVDLDEMRKCPSCAEMVRAEAIRCRFCQIDLIPVVAMESIQS